MNELPIWQRRKQTTMKETKTKPLYTTVLSVLASTMSAIGIEMLSATLLG